MGANHLFWRHRLLCDSVLRGFRDLHCCGTVWQKFCSAKLTLCDFEARVLFSKCLREDDLYSDSCQDYSYFTSPMFEALFEIAISKTALFAQIQKNFSVP